MKWIAKAWSVSDAENFTDEQQLQLDAEPPRFDPAIQLNVREDAPAQPHFTDCLDHAFADEGE